MLPGRLVLPGIICAITLMLIATLYYPGGSQADINSVGYDWKSNYISNLFAEKALNGLENTARFWAVGGMFFLTVSFSLFFADFSRKMPAKGAATIIKYAGIMGMVAAFLIATSLHDIMITISCTLFLISLFYITVFVFRSRLHVIKFLCVVCLLIFYATLYIYGSGSYRSFLPILQKITFASTILLVIGLTYFTEKKDFESITSYKAKTKRR